MDNKEIIKERLEILPDTLKSFVLDENWRREAEKIGKQFNLDEEKYASFENEIFLTLLCFEPKSDFAENIKAEVGLDQNISNWVAEDVNKNIFSAVEYELEQINQMVEQEEQADNTEENIQTEAEENAPEEAPEEMGESEEGNSIGQSFEQIISNQARAMQPARPPGNLPTGNKQPEVHNYMPGQDPYREPLE